MEKNETNEKQYYSISLEKMLSKYITRQNYGNFSIILKEIFQRRAYEFDFSEAHMEQEVSNFINKVKSVQFVAKEEMNSETNMGLYEPNESTIKINQDFYLDFVNENSELTFGTQMLETLTHEVYHGITDVGSEMGLMYYSRFKWRGTALNEIFTETAANRASRPRGAKEAEQYRADTDGYPDITFVTNLLAASIGVSEKELLRGGCQNRKQLMQVVASKFPKGLPHFEANKLLKKIESSLDLIYNIRYSKNMQKTEEQIDIETQLMGGALTTLYGTAFDLASHQITHDNKDFTSESVADVKYRYSKMEKIMQDSLALFEDWNIISPEIKQRVQDNTIRSREALADRVIGMETIMQEGDKITDFRDLEIMMKAAKNGSFEKNANVLYNKYGIIVPEATSLSVSAITGNLEYGKYVMKEDFDDGRVWDNRDVSNVIKKIFVAEMERKGISLQSSIDTYEKPIVDDPYKTAELSVVEPTEELVVVNGQEKKKGIFEKIKDSINIIITRFKNRNQLKLPISQETRDDNSEYYASLATKTVESTLDRYVVKPKAPSLTLENIEVGQESKKEQNNRETQDDDGR